MPEVDPRVIQAIEEGRKRREEGITNERAILQAWFAKDFFQIIADRVSEGTREANLCAKYNPNPFALMRFMSYRDALDYLHGFISQVVGLTATIHPNEYIGHFISVKW